MLVVVGDDEQNYVTTYINKILYCVRPRVHARRARRREQYYRTTYINSWIVSAYFIKTSLRHHHVTSCLHERCREDKDTRSNV